jgi:hypothetical protein
MGWLSGPIAQILGIRAFWIARIAKVAQFLSGMYIIVDIWGPERVKKSTDAVLNGLSRIVESKSIGQITADIWEASKCYLLSCLSGDKEKSDVYSQRAEQTKTFGRAVKAAFVLAFLTWIWQMMSVTIVILTGYAEILSYDDFRRAALQLGTLLLIGLTSTIIMVFIGYVVFLLAWLVLIFVTLNLVRFVLLVVGSPAKWAFDLLASCLIRILRNRGLARLLLGLSLFLTAMSCILELLVS